MSLQFPVITAAAGMAPAPSAGSANRGVAVPDVTGKTRAEAEAALVDFQVVVQTVEVTGGADGTVYTQNPAKPSIRPRGSVVTITVVENPTPGPDFGKRFDELDDALGDVATAVEDIRKASAALEGKIESSRTDLLTAIQKAADDLKARIEDRGGPSTSFE